MIEYMKGHEGVWFATGIAIADWWLKQNFSEKPAPLRIAGNGGYRQGFTYRTISLFSTLPAASLKLASLSHGIEMLYEFRH